MSHLVLTMTRNAFDPEVTYVMLYRGQIPLSPWLGARPLALPQADELGTVSPGGGEAGSASCCPAAGGLSRVTLPQKKKNLIVIVIIIIEKAEWLKLGKRGLGGGGDAAWAAGDRCFLHGLPGQSLRAEGLLAPGALRFPVPPPEGTYRCWGDRWPIWVCHPGLLFVHQILSWHRPWPA